MKENKVGTYSFAVEPFHVDFTGKLSMEVLGNQLLNSAGRHAEERGFGMKELNESNYTWVLSRLAMDLNDLQMQHEEYSIDTWVENVYRLFTDRNFAIYGKDGKVYGYVRSVWAMINLDTRKPADLLTLYGGSIVDYIEEDRDCPMEKPGRIKVGSSMPVRSLEMYYSNIYINGHVNSMKYVEHVLDLFPKDWHAEHRISRFEMAYIAESHFGDTLSFFREEGKNGTFDVEVRKNVGGEYPEGEGVCRSKINFANK
ncbi:MAG: thioesterase [Paraprevotella sp.]|nr:thioesterase [Paraprevotella sp.]